MNIMDMIREMHQTLMDILDNIEADISLYEKKKKHLKSLTKIFVAYSYAKERNFYGPLRKRQEARLSVLQTMEIQTLVDQLLWQMETEDLVDEEWYVKYKTARGLILNIFEADEKHIFVLAKQLLKHDSLNHLGYVFQEDKKRIQQCGISF